MVPGVSVRAEAALPLHSRLCREFCHERSHEGGGCALVFAESSGNRGHETGATWFRTVSVYNARTASYMRFHRRHAARCLQVVIQPRHGDSMCLQAVKTRTHRSPGHRPGRHATSSITQPSPAPHTRTAAALARPRRPGCHRAPLAPAPASTRAHAHLGERRRQREEVGVAGRGDVPLGYGAPYAAHALGLVAVHTVAELARAGRRSNLRKACLDVLVPQVPDFKVAEARAVDEAAARRQRVHFGVRRRVRAQTRVR